MTYYLKLLVTLVCLTLYSLSSRMLYAATEGNQHVVRDEVIRDAGHAMQSTKRLPLADPAVVDIGVFYAQELLQRGRTLTSLDASVATMIGFANTAFEATGLPLTLRVTYAQVYDERLDGINTNTAHQLLRLSAIALRDTVLSDFGVDAVVLIKATDDVDDLFGVATLGTESNLSDSTTVPAAVVCLGAAQTGGLECFGAGGIFAHEVGHLFGAGHQRNAPVGGSGGAFEFSYASECGGGTIVYSPVSAAQRIFSTPNISANGRPCGVAASQGADGIDNAHTLDLTRGLMAALRPTMPVYGAIIVDGATDYSVSEGDAPVLLQLRRDGDLSRSARVSLAVVSRVDSSPDIVIDPAEVVFEPGQDAAIVTINLVDDAKFEPLQTVEVGLRNPWRMESAPVTVRLNITDNDPLPPPPVPAPRAPEGSGGGGISLLLVLALLCVTATRVRNNARGIGAD